MMNSKVHKQTRFKRKAITLEEKLEVIKRYENCERTCDIARVTGFNEATLRSIRSNAESIKKCYADSTPVGAKRSIKIRPKAMQVMEKHLIVWIQDEIIKKPNISLLDIKVKALKIFENVKKDFPSEINLNFTASNGWFHRFKVRHQLQNIRFNADGLIANSLSIQSIPQNSTRESIYNKHFEKNSAFASENSILKTCLLSNSETYDEIKNKNDIESTNEADLCDIPIKNENTYEADLYDIPIKNENVNEADLYDTSIKNENTNEADSYDIPIKNVLKNLSQIEEALSNLQKLDNKVKNSSIIIKEVKHLLKPYYDLLQPNFKNDIELSEKINSPAELETFCEKDLISDSERLKESFDLEDTCEMILPI